MDFFDNFANLTSSFNTTVAGTLTTGALLSLPANAKKDPEKAYAKLGLKMLLGGMFL